VTVAVSGVVLGQLIVLAASPLLTRLYTPDDFGALGVFAALLQIVGIAVCLRYELAIPLAEDEVSAVNLLALSLLITLAVSGVIGVVVGSWGGVIAGWLNTAALGALLWLLPVGLLGVGCARALTHWAIRHRLFGLITRTRISRSLGQVGTQLGGGYLGLGPIGLLVGQIVGQSAGITTLALALHRAEGRVWRTVRPREMMRVAVRFAEQLKFGAAAALLSNGARFVPALLVAAVHGIEVAGWFALAQRILAAPLLFSVAVAQVYLGEAPRLARAGHGELYGLFKGTAWRLFAFGLASVALVVVAGPQLFGLVFGAAWTEAGRYAQFLAIMALGQLVIGPIAQTLIVLERQDLQLVRDALRFGALLLVFFAAHQLAWTPLLTIAVMSLVMAIGDILLFLLIRRLILAHMNPRG